MSETPWIHDEATRVVINDEYLYNVARRCKRLHGIRRGAVAFHDLHGELLADRIGLTVSKTACITVMRNV